MAILIANPIAVLRGTYQGIKPCKNPNYFNLILALEYDIPAPGLRPELLLHDSEDMHKFQSLEQGKSYHFKVSVGVQKASEKNGKSYSGTW
jgi:hypothetical protein